MIPMCFWSGVDEKDFAEAAYMAAINRPLAGSVQLSPQAKSTAREPEDYDGGVTRIEGASWVPFERNTDWVEASRRWARANLKPAMLK